MALEATFRNLTICLHRLHDAVGALQITTEDKPEHDVAAIADDMADKALDMMGLLHETRKAALHARRALGHPPDLDRARRALTACQEHFHRVERLFSTNLQSYDKLSELTRLAKVRGGEWLPWSGSMKLGIDQCGGPLQEVNRCLARCWQEIAEHAGAMSVSVRNTSIGQKIEAKSSETGDVSYERTS